MGGSKVTKNDITENKGWRVMTYEIVSFKSKNDWSNRIDILRRIAYKRYCKCSPTVA
jgi:hypothetical protein